MLDKSLPASIPHSLHRWTPITSALLLFILITSFGLYRYFDSVTQLQHEMAQQLKSQNTQYTQAIQQVVQHNIYQLGLLASVLTQRTDFSQSEFVELSQKFLEHSPEIKAVEFLPKVLDKDRLTHEAEVQALGYPTYQISERNDKNAMVKRSVQAVYYPVMWVEPFLPNQKAHGFDVNSRPFNKVMIKQLSEGIPFLFSPPFQLVQEESNEKSVLLYMPVKEKATDALRGVVLFILRVPDILEASQLIARFSKPMGYDLKDITLYSVEVGDDSRLQKAIWLDNQMFKTEATVSKLGTIYPSYPISYRAVLGFGETQWEMNFKIDLQNNLKYQSQVTAFRQNIFLYLLFATLLGFFVYFSVRDFNRFLKLREQLEFEQDRVQALFYKSSDLYFLFSATGRLVEVNQSSCEVLGYRHDHLIDLKLEDYWVNPQSFLKNLEGLLVGETWEGETDLQNRDGSVVSVQCSVLKVEREGKSYYSCLAKDLTGYKNQVKALETAVEQSEKVGRLKSEFLANMSHELRTPLHGVLSFATLGETRADSEKIKSYFSAIRVSGERLLKLLTEILELAKLESTQMKFEFKSVEFNALVAACLREQNSEMARKNIRLEMRSSSTEMQVVCDDLRIHQVIANLLSNAIKFTPAYGLIEVKWSIKIDTPSVLVFYVYNEGEGIEEAELESIFDKFVQADKHAKLQMGTGLGLSICREIIKRHNGNIWAESKVGEYARFSFTLPLEGSPHLLLAEGAHLEHSKTP
ncbi:CHASE domain-containing protein [Thiosulfativibrio zosterae]|uniref:histidine kinase n=1 Tax=Thiosulfativibrio zosterae TaxID=2675053 RepID=A0A6F8PNJ1_9GAMM|nr:CHASE domain-containing protein [Thiosulfativibrio zosterae]BBP43682.1 hypothetical protein THMIRHAT_14280 [Thiosulfativibrio zosterae]